MSYWISRVSPGLLKSALAEGLSIGEPQARVLVVLLQHQGEGLSTKRLQYLLDPHKPVRRNVFQERIRVLRQAMGRDAIGGFLTAAQRAGRSGDGKPSRFQETEYTITELGIEKCQAALAKVADAIQLREAEPSQPLRKPHLVGS